MEDGNGEKGETTFPESMSLGGRNRTCFNRWMECADRIFRQKGRAKGRYVLHNSKGLVAPLAEIRDGAQNTSGSSQSQRGLNSMNMLQG